MGRQEYPVGLKGLRRQKEDGKDMSVDTLKYWGRLGTLIRRKMKVRVPPPRDDKIFDFESIAEARFPKNRGEKLSAEHPPECPFAACDPECETCFCQYFPARIEVSDAEALACVKHLSDSINTDRAFLLDAVAQNADWLVGRWKKKSVAKRMDLLDSLSRELTTEELQKATTDEEHLGVRLHKRKWGAVELVNRRSHHPNNDVDLRRHLDKANTNRDVIDKMLQHKLLDFIQVKTCDMQSVQYLTTWLLPYLDIESLSEDPMLFLQLLHKRTTYSPEAWMMFDNIQIRLSENWQTLVPEFNKHCVNMSGPKYGAELVPWEASRCHRWEIVGYNKAKHILTAQRAMMLLLREIVRALLSERQTSVGGAASSAPSIPTTEAGGNPKWNLLVDSGFTSFGKSPSSQHFIRGSAKQPFSAPPTFDAVSALECVESMYRAALDELELSQTDPAFLQLAVRDLAASAYFDRVDSESRWNWFADEVLCSYYRRFVWWRQMLKECTLLVESYQAYQAQPTEVTRKAYEAGMLVVHSISTEHLVNQMGWVDYSLPFQPGFERNYDWEQSRNPDGSRQPAISAEDAFENDKLFWSLKGLGFDEHRLFTMEPSFHFRVLDDYLLRGNREAKGRLSKELLRHVSDMAAVDEIRTSIECDRTWDREPSDIEDHDTPSFRADFIAKYAKKLSIPELIDEGKLPAHLRKLCEKTPWPKGPIDQTWLDRATDARAALDSLWAAFRSSLESQQQRKDFPKYLMDEDRLALTVASRPEHLAFVENERQMVQSRSKKKENKTATQSTSDTSGLWQHDPSQDKFTPVQLRDKKKTRGHTDSEDKSLDDLTDQLAFLDTKTAVEPRHKIKVRPENFRLFSAMYPTDKNHTRAYSWKHFTSAMVDAGMSMTQSSGSAVSFKNDMGTIVFHQPHPDPTIDPIMLLSMGKRLRKWFGWDAGVFVESKA